VHLRSKLLATTLTELSAIATLANFGSILTPRVNQPKPIAMGTRIALYINAQTKLILILRIVFLLIRIAFTTSARSGFRQTIDAACTVMSA